MESDGDGEGRGRGAELEGRVRVVLRVGGGVSRPFILRSCDGGGGVRELRVLDKELGALDKELQALDKGS